MTPLHVAAERAHNDILEVLQKHGAKVNAVDTLGQTALHRAALAGHIQTCKLLLSFGADPSVVSLQGFTAAQMGNEAVQQILNGTVAAASLTLPRRESEHTHTNNLSLLFPENVPTRNSDVDYRFLEAAKAGDLDTVQVCWWSWKIWWFLVCLSQRRAVRAAGVLPALRPSPVRSPS